MTFVRTCRPQSTAARRHQPAAHALLSLAFVGVFAWPLAAPARAQQPVTVQRDGEAFLADPGGKQLGRVSAGAAVTVQGRRARDTQVTLDGWIFRSSVKSDRREGHTLSVTPVEENLRLGPNGRVLARLVRGALLDEVERRGAWVHVRRGGWIATSAIGPGAARTAAQQATAAPAGDSSTPEDVDPRRAVLRRRVQLFRAPDVPTTGFLDAGMPVRITARAGQWVRVEAQGWVKESEVRPPGGQAVSGVTAAELRANPDEWRGKVLRWTIQFISLQTADELRSDFAPGQRYILARGPAPEYAFVYVTVPPNKLEEVAGLRPLASVTVLARVRSGRSAYLANPILDLLDIVQ
jgi:SH3-like domain-containing protein